MALRRTDLLRVFARSLWLQASWSFEGMQSLGFAYAMDPALERIYGHGTDLAEARARHLEFFNTHPYLAAAVLGSAVRLEAEGGEGAQESIRRLKAAVMGPYGALGDSFFWAALKPLLAVLALLAAAGGRLWAPWAFLGAYLAVSLAARAHGFWLGYRRGVAVVEALGRLRLLLWAGRLKLGCSFALGGLVVASAAALPPWGIDPLVWAAGAGTFVLGGAWLLARGLRPTWMVWLSAVASAAVTACT